MKVNAMRGLYNKYPPKLHARISKWVTTHTIASTSKHFTKELGFSISESTVCSIKQVYIERLQKARKEARAQASALIADVHTLPTKRRGRPLLLGEVDIKVQLYLEKVQEKEGGISSRIAIVAGHALLWKYNRFFVT